MPQGYGRNITAQRGGPRNSPKKAEPEADSLTGREKFWKAIIKNRVSRGKNISSRASRFVSRLSRRGLYR